MTKRLALRSLRVVDGDRPPAEVTFTNGLNVVVGASDTGKTFIFEAIDFMLGARGPLRRVPQSRAYVDVLLHLDPSAQAPVTLRRAFSGGDFLATEFANGRSNAPTATRTLSAVHSKDPARSLSAYLLNAIGIQNREIRKNSSGVKQSLSFRNLCHVTLISEERIIQQASPVLTGQNVAKTADEGVFAFLLTGLDDSAVVTVEARQDRDARLAVQADLVTTLLQERHTELAALGVAVGSVAAEAQRLDAEIDEATRVVVSSQEQIEAYERRRDALVTGRAQAQSRLAFVDDQLRRLTLLASYYDTDRARLETLLHASRAFHTLPEGQCPFCHRPYDASSLTADHEQFEAACAAEINKISTLARELTSAIRDFELESVDLQRRVTADSAALSEVEAQLQGVLAPSATTTQSSLDALVKSRSLVAQAATLQSAIEGLEERLAKIAALRATKPGKPTFERKATTSATTELCGIVGELLSAWKYPNLGRVSYDPQRCDLVIGDQDRGNKGKGYRAITYAAFVIGLMRYCATNGIPHPGFVVLDTPLNPFKGPTVVPLNERIGDDVKTAFFEDLARSTTEDQVIIMENEAPPEHVRSRIAIHEFTKNRRVGRYGFFPLA